MNLHLKKSLQVPRRISRAIIKHLYINLVQVEWMLGLFAAFFLGAKSYWYVVLFVGTSLVLGYVTSYLYWFLIETSGRMHGKEGSTDDGRRKG